VLHNVGFIKHLSWTRVISDIIFHPFRKRCSHHFISSLPLLPASEHPAWPVLLMFFQFFNSPFAGPFAGENNVEQ
jgi:hypothetical protein